MSKDAVKTKIGIAVHSNGPIEPTIYSNHIAMFSAWAKKNKIMLLTLDRAKVADARNALVERAIGENCTHILFLDTDHIVDENMLGCLLGNRDATVVSGLVCRKDATRTQVGFVKKDDGLYYSLELPTDGMSYSVDACAFGCTLIDLDVFKDIVKPWFKDRMITRPDGTLVQRRSDMNFCDDVRDMGKSIYIDTRVIIGHLKQGEAVYPIEKEFQVATYRKAAELICEHSLESAIDFGCGFGKKLIKFIEPIVDGSIYGLDVKSSAKFCDETYTDSKIVWVGCDLEEVRIDFNQFAMVICADVLEHLKKPENLIETILSTMHKDSYAVISTPDIDTISERCVTNEEHRQFWNKNEFVEFLESRGLEVISTEQFKERSGYMSTICVCRKKV